MHSYTFVLNVTHLVQETSLVLSNLLQSTHLHLSLNLFGPSHLHNSIHVYTLHNTYCLRYKRYMGDETGPDFRFRLWCMFELAAFMKSRSKPSPHDVVIRPTLLGAFVGAG